MPLEIQLLHRLSLHKGSLYALEKLDAGAFFAAGSEGLIVEWNLKEADRATALVKVNEQIFSVSYLKNKNQLAIGTMSGALHVIELNEKKEIHFITLHTQSIFDIQCFDGKIFVASKDGTLSVWNEEFQLQKQIRVSEQGLRCMAFLPEKKLIAIGSSDHAVYLCDAETLQVKRVLREAANSIFTVAFSADGNYLLAGSRDALLYVFDANDFSLLHKINAHWYTINHILFLSGTGLFATASRDRTIRLWNAGDFSPVKSLDAQMEGHKHSVNRLLWMQESSILVSASDDKSILVWQLRAE